MDYFTKVSGVSPRPHMTDPVQFSKIVSEEINIWLVQQPLEAVVKEILFSFKSGKTPGPSSFIASFFQKFWTELRGTIMGCVRDFFQRRPILKAIIHTLITLVPKKKSVTNLADFRSISCANTIISYSLKSLHVG